MGPKTNAHPRGKLPGNSEHRLTTPSCPARPYLRFTFFLKNLRLLPPTVTPI